MKRRLIKQGGGGFTFYLPKKWADKNNLKAGDEINIEEDAELDKLIITAEEKPKLLTSEIIIDKHSYDFISRIITNAYKNGVDELKLSFKKEMPIEAVNDALSTLTIGYEITDAGKDYCIIKCFSSADAENIDVSIRKCFLLVKEMNQIILSDIKAEKFPNKKKIESLNVNIRKLTNYAVRTTIKTMKNVNAALYNIKIFTNLYLFSIKLNYIYAYLEKEKKLLPSTINLLEQLFDMHNLFYEAYYKKNLDLIHELMLSKDKLVKYLDNYADKGNGKSILQISMSMRCIHDSVSALIGRIID